MPKVNRFVTVFYEPDGNWIAITRYNGKGCSVKPRVYYSTMRRLVLLSSVIRKLIRRDLVRINVHYNGWEAYVKC